MVRGSSTGFWPGLVAAVSLLSNQRRRSVQSQRSHSCRHECRIQISSADYEGLITVIRASQWYEGAFTALLTSQLYLRRRLNRVEGDSCSKSIQFPHPFQQSQRTSTSTISCSKSLHFLSLLQIAAKISTPVEVHEGLRRYAHAHSRPLYILACPGARVGFPNPISSS